MFTKSPSQMSRLCTWPDGTTADYPQSTEENTEAQATPQTTGPGLVLCLSGSQARAVSGAGGWGRGAGWGGWSSRRPLTILSSLCGSVGLGCGLGRGRPGAGQQARTCSPGWKGASLPVLPWVEGAPGALDTPSLPALLGSVFPESRDSWAWAPRTSHQLSAGARSRLGALPGGAGGAGGDERAFVSLCVKLGMTASHWGGLLLLEVSAQSPVGGSALCLSGVGDTPLGLHFSPSPLPALVSQHTHSPTRRPASLSHV